MDLYTSRERKGLTILLLTTSALLVIYYNIPFLFKPKVVDYTALFTNFDDTKAQLQVSSKEDRSLVALSPFDVNAITAEGLQGVGLSKSAAKAWVNYRNAIGGFKKIEQIEKIYGLDRQWVDANKVNLLFDNLKNKTALQEVVEYEPSEPSALTFDPNTADLSDLEAAGLKEETIVALQKYKNRGGTIYRKEELAYLAGVNDSSFTQIASAIEIESEFLPPLLVDDSSSATTFDAEKIANRAIEIDINDSNEYQWQQLKGVGPYYARSIIKYRNLLGGFSDVDQVAETYNFPDSVFQAIRPYLISSPIINKISINTINVDSLRLHPYLNWKQASILVNYRNNHGPYEKIGDLYLIRVFDTAFVKKMEPYITFKP